MLFYPYTWASLNNAVIAFSIDDEGKTIKVQIPTDWIFFVELPENANTIVIEELKNSISQSYPQIDSIELVRMERLTRLNIDKFGNKKTWPLLKCTCQEFDQMRRIAYTINKHGIFRGHGLEPLMLSAYYHDLEGWKQFILRNNLPVSDWIEVTEWTSKKDRVIVKSPKCLTRLATQRMAPRFRVLSFDIEVYPSQVNVFPRPEIERNDIFLICAIIDGQNIAICSRKLLVKELKDMVTVDKLLLVESESQLIDAFVEVIKLYKPHVIIGYNVMGFDWDYLIKRANTFAATKSLQSLSRSSKQPEEVSIKWKSAQTTDMVISYLAVDGIVMMDLFSIVRREYRLSSYNLEFVSQHFLKRGKNDIDHVIMHDILTNNRVDRIHELVAYCIQDCQLVVDLLAQLKIVEKAFVLANKFNVLVQDLYTRGQTMRVVGYIMGCCANWNILPDGKKHIQTGPEESYQGATVLDPVIGYHKNVVSFDFNSLYPSMIAAHNLCPSTLVSQESDLNPTFYNSLVWDEHIRCEHDAKWLAIDAKKQELQLMKMNIKHEPHLKEQVVVLEQELVELKKYKPNQTFCGTRRARWLKDQYYTGVYPRIVRELIASRKEVKKQLARAKVAEPMDQNLVDYLDLLQNTIKCVANSLYGFTGSNVSPFPCREVAMCTTSLGRQCIAKAANIITDQFGGRVVYGDTDSNYVVFKDMTPLELYAKCPHIAEHISSQFPDGVNIEFEDTVYGDWLILAKKCYIWRVVNKNGEIDPKIKAKGNVLVRRDNCQYVRDLYRKVVEQIFSNPVNPLKGLEQIIVDAMIDMITNFRSILDKFVMSTQIHDIGDEEIVEVGPVSSTGKIMIGSYKVTAGKGESGLPPHVKMARDMRRHGIKVQSGERLLYIVINPDETSNGLTGKMLWLQATKNCSFVIDYFYYAKFFITKLSQVIGAINPDKENMVANIVDMFKKKAAINAQIIARAAPKQLNLT